MLKQLRAGAKQAKGYLWKIIKSLSYLYRWLALKIWWRFSLEENWNFSDRIKRARWSAAFSLLNYTNPRIRILHIYIAISPSYDSVTWVAVVRQTTGTRRNRGIQSIQQNNLKEISSKILSCLQLLSKGRYIPERGLKKKHWCCIVSTYIYLRICSCI